MGSKIQSLTIVLYPLVALLRGGSIAPGSATSSTKAAPRGFAPHAARQTARQLKAQRRTGRISHAPWLEYKLADDPTQTIITLHGMTMRVEARTLFLMVIFFMGVSWFEPLSREWQGLATREAAVKKRRKRTKGG